ncbi:hypothetical protein Y032_0789g2365 [Ancylostoma ceylanicum]|uniref:Uncharacterized protein n=1 Tax=Ancylostoma ceylanicum TaxID=53326 RepID=A0A016WCV5_9BILA|nr:hypothetical protein Y032_0789g2365 [Ancylostoma ceylanicum]
MEQLILFCRNTIVLVLLPFIFRVEIVLMSGFAGLILIVAIVAMLCTFSHASFIANGTYVKIIYKKKPFE